MVSIKNKKRGVIVFAVLLIFGAATTYALIVNDSQNTKTAPNPPAADGINYNPPTAQDKKETEAHKQQLENTSTDTPTSSGSKQATVFLASVSSTEARGYVSNVFEEGGSCSIILTRGSLKITGKSAAFSDVNKTTCAPLSFDELSPGDWTAILSYTSSTSSGSSSPRIINIP